MRRVLEIAALQLRASYDRPRRLILAAAVASVVFAMVWVGHAPPAEPADWDFVWVGARAILHRDDPYAAVQREIDAGRMSQRLYYPATAPVLMAPLGALPLRWAISLFTALGMALLAYSLPAWRLPLLISAPAVHAVLLGQWSPWLTAAVGLPWLGLVFAAKPTTGLALFVAWPTRKALVAMALLVGLTTLLLPHWPWEWREAVRGTPQYLAPVQRPGGWLLLLAWLRWRSPEGRLLGTLALVPHTTGLHEMLAPLFVARSRRELLVLQGLGYLATYLIYTQTHYGPDIVPQQLREQWPYFLGLVYLPALAVVLRRGAGRLEASDPAGTGSPV